LPFRRRFWLWFWPVFICANIDFVLICVPEVVTTSSLDADGGCKCRSYSWTRSQLHQSSFRAHPLWRWTRWMPTEIWFAFSAKILVIVILANFYLGQYSSDLWAWTNIDNILIVLYWWS
jgi:hypothetical protein